MDLRTRSHTHAHPAHATSGPGRDRAGDGRAPNRRPRGSHHLRSRHLRRRARRRRVEQERTRLRAEALFAPPSKTNGPGASAALPREPTRRDEPAGPPERKATSPATEAAVPGGEAAVASRRARTVAAVRDRLPLWLQARCGVERRGAVALAVLLGAVALFAVQHFWSGRTQPVRAPEVVRAAPRSVGAAADAAGGGVPSAPASAPGPVASGGAEIVVDVSGKVRRPGIRRLPAGARVADALRAAGGIRPGTDTAGLNKARLLMDGEQVLVGEPAGVAPPAGPAPGGGSTGPIALNTATVEQLDSLPGVGPVLARHIVDYRTQHGGFRSVDELREVDGIGPSRFDDLHDLVRP
ncbi:ComEA family DNA-binding protein [Streptomyces sp. GXMU-J5]|uniref:ComEA family DNA-binding protein n=1 Tax=Streptomyces beihaiensis TaxID=2984495 RepID=A0ABT3U4U3_9ACTN|nr:ComEA family DNA-binding protein [Streptomyces beihaiensis]